MRGAITAQAGRWFLWTPVAMGSGAAIYIGARTEPSAALAAGLFSAAVTLAVLIRRIAPYRILVIAATLLAFGAFGFAAAKWRTLSVAAPIAPATEAVWITGWVVDVATPGESGGRLLIKPTQIGDLPPGKLPVRIRVTADKDMFGPGMAVGFTGLLNPPPPPASPGGYDFARNSWFDRIGGVGVALTEPQAVTLARPGLALQWKMKVNAVRWSLARRIAERMSPDAAGLGVAMVTGHGAWIAPETETALQDAGLAHIISISGLHMAIVGGFAFFLVRVFIAAWPWLALRVPGKKIAAAFGLFSIATYLVISGSPAPAERAAVTAAVAFCAILVDRRAISLRSLAIAALIVITLQPEAVAEAGFQMSFAATAALVALFEAWKRGPREINTPLAIKAVQAAFRWLGVAMGASLVAGAATGPFAIQHFNRVAVFGLPANLLSEPISSFVLMPSLAIGAVLEPIGLGRPFLWVAGLAIEVLQAGALFVASLPHATLLIASAPQAALPIAFLGILWMCLWRGKGLWLGLPAALAISLCPRPEAPIAWFDNEGQQAAVRVGDQAILMRPDDRQFAAEYWTRRRGLTVDPEADQSGVFACDGSSCRAVDEAGPRVSVWWTVRKPKPEALDALCRSSDVLALRADVPVPPSCAGVKVLKPADFAKGGSLEIYADGRWVWAQSLRGERPWTMNQ